MSEAIDGFRAMREVSRIQRAANCLEAEKGLAEAKELAKRHGLMLGQHTMYHYQLLKAGEWSLNIYPSNRKLDLRGVPGDAGNLYDLHLPEDWTLLDVVKAAVKAVTPTQGKES